MRSWRGPAFWLALATYAVYANWALATMLPAPIPTEDSHGYMTWSLVRTLGYPLLIGAYDLVATSWAHFPAVQLNLVLAGTAALCWGTARVTGSYLAGWLVLALVAANARVPLFSAQIMTEAPFAAMVMLHLGAMYFVIASGTRLAAIVAALALAAAVLVKSVGIVLLGPALLLLASRQATRPSLLAIVIAPALLAWLLPASTNLLRHGFFDGSTIGGYALLGHVAWAVHPRPGSPHPELAARLESRLAPVLARRPAWDGSRSLYVSYTSDEYNELLWRNIVPETIDYLAPQCPGGFGPCTWKSCAVACAALPNRVTMALARDAIAAQPRDYAYHVFAHGEGSWRLVFSRPIDLLAGLREGAVALPYYYREDITHVRGLLEPVPEFKPPGEIAAQERSLSGHPLKHAADLVTLSGVVRPWLAEPLGGSASRVLAWIGLAASLLVFRARRLSPAAMAFCYTGLCLNAYFLGTALFQPALERYSWAMQGATAALLATGLAAALAYRRREARKSS